MMIRYRSLFTIVVFFLLPITGFAETSTDQDTQIPEVEIIGKKLKETVLLHEQNQISLSAEEVINMPGTGDDPLRALDNLPGISQAGDGVYMHGSSTTDNKLLIDNLSVPYLYHFGDMLSLVNKDVLAGYDVYPSGFDAVFGNRLGGVIDIQLRDPVADGDIDQRFHLGTFDTSYFIEGGITDRDSAYFSLRRSHLDLLLSGSSMDDVDFIQFPKFIDAVARWKHELDNGEINSTFIASTDELLFDLKEAAVDDDKSAIGRLQAKQSFYTLGTQYSSEINKAFYHETGLKYLSSSSELKLGTQQAGDPDPGQPYNFDFSVNETRFVPALFWIINDTDEAQFTLDRIRGFARLTGYISAPPDERDDPGDNLTKAEKFKLDENLKYDATGFSGSYHKQWNEQLSTTLSIRYETFSLYDNSITAPLSPRFSLSHLLNEELKLTASYGIYYQVPQGFELIESLGNPELEYQQAEHRTLGMHVQLNEDWSAQFSIYQKPMQDLVVETENELHYNNNGSGEARGFDLFIKRNPLDRKLDWLSYTFAESDRVNHNTGLTRPFDGDQTHTLIWVHQQPFSDDWSAWQWGFKLKAHSGKPFTRVIDREALSLDSGTDCEGDGGVDNCYWSPLYESQNKSRLPVHFSIDLSMNKTVVNHQRHYDIKLELLNASALIYENIGDYEYGDDYEYIENPKKVSSGFGFLPAASFTLYF